MAGFFRTVVACSLAGTLLLPSCRQLNRWLLDRPVRTIVLVSLDTTRRDHLGLYGYERPTTPMLDAFSQDALIFEDAVAAHTNTCPSHASMLTGLSPQTHGAINNGVAKRKDVTSIVTLLATAGYRTGGFVSSHTLAGKHCGGVDEGFETYAEPAGRRVRRGKETAKLATTWLRERNRDEKVFLFLHLYDPHFRYDPPASFLERFAPVGPTPTPPRDAKKLRTQSLDAGEDRPEELQLELQKWIRLYDGEIAYADAVVGQLLDGLREIERYDDALIIVTADHGETLDERRWVLDHGARVSEEQIRIPLVIRPPEGSGGGRRVSGQVGHVDLGATILSAASIDLPSWVQGRALQPTFRGNALPGRPAFCLARRVPARLVEVERPLPPATRFSDPAGLVASIRSPPYKLTDYAPMSPEPSRALHNLDTDPEEEHDILDKEPEIAARLGTLLDAWWQATGGTRPARSQPMSEETREALRALGYIE